MNVRKTWGLAGALGVLLAFGAIIVSAQPGPGGFGGLHGKRGARGAGGPGGPGGPGPIALHHLDLTDAQKEQIRTLHQQQRETFHALMETAGTARRALDEAALAGDEAGVRAKAAEFAAAQTELAVAQAQVHAAVFKLLTPEQQQKALAARQRMQQVHELMKKPL
jgi:Spy/CpxP family protein refolding chaperone